MKAQILKFLLMSLLASRLFAQQADQQSLLAGVRFIETTPYSDQENAKVLKLYEGLRVADVSDGMDMVGLPGTGLVDPAIHPDWTNKDLSHQFRGIRSEERRV